MDVDMDDDSQSKPRFIRPTNSGINSFLADSSHSSSNPMPYSTQSLSRRLAPNSIGLQMTPTKMLLNQTRRSSSGIFITSMFGSRFRHLQKLHSEAFLGLNSICLPGLPMGAVFRSSLPATPVATPLHREAFQQFSEQALRDRLCRTPSPRKNRSFLSMGSEQTNDHQMRSDSSCSQSGLQDSILSDQPMDITCPMIDEPVIEDTKEEESANGGGCGQHFFKHDDRLQRNPSDLYERRVFVGNISYRVKESELTNFFRKFGKVYNCCIVKDHVKKLPKGYGFITFQKSSDCQSVLNADPNELILDNRQLRVFRSEPKITSQMKKQIQGINEERHQIIELRDELSNQLLNYEKRTEVVTINDLDDDVILQIFSNLDALKDKTIVEFVCKRWRELMQQLWSSQTHISLMSSFLIFGSPALETKTLFSILKKCPNLRSIDLRHVTTFLDSKALEIIAVSCPHLEHLFFDSGITTDYSIKVLGEKCPKLKSLYLNDCTHLKEKGFWWLLKNASNLETLEIKNNQKVNGNCFRVLSESLKSLDITNCVNIKEKGISELVNKSRNSLKCLSLSSINYNILKAICFNLKNLTILRISYKTPINEQLNEELVGFSLISELKNLEILENCAQFQDINNESMKSVLWECRQLKELMLALNYSITDESMQLIPEYLPNLQKLCAINSKITNESLIKWSVLNDLKYLDISRSQFISDSGVKSLLTNSMRLSFLQLNDCENISLDCIKYFMEYIFSDSLYPELIICFNNIRINTKKQDFKEIEDIIVERDKYLFFESESEESDLEDSNNPND